MYDKIKYNIEYNKNNYKKFACNLRVDEYENASKLLEKHSMNKAEFIRWAINELDKKK